MPFVRGVAEDFMGGANINSIRRIGLAVYPGNGQDNNQGDKSGPAQTRISLSTGALSQVVSMTTDGEKDNDDAQAASGLRFPKSGWTYTSTWTALEQARIGLFDSDYSGTYQNHRKVVLLITDGAPERNTEMGNDMKRARPTYLSLYFAQQLKDRGAQILAVVRRAQTKLSFEGWGRTLSLPVNLSLSPHSLSFALSLSPGPFSLTHSLSL